VENYMATYLIDVVALAFLCCLIHSNNILNRNRKWPFYFSSMLIVLIIVAEGGTIITGDGNWDYGSCPYRSCHLRAFDAWENNPYP
jgi:hypothetical protein